MILYIRNYGFVGFFKLSIYKLKTLLLFPSSRLIRFPIDIRNRDLIDFGKGLTTGVGCRLEAYNVNIDNNIKISFGQDVQINDFVHIAAGKRVSIGNNVLIASKVYISDINHGNYNGLNPDSPYTLPALRRLHCNEVVIEDNVWIGESVTILPGVKVGFGSIIGANSIVTRDVPAKSIVVGNPAKIIKSFNDSTSVWDIIRS